MSGRKRDIGRTDYSSGHQKRKKKQEREKKAKKEQTQMRRLDQFYMTSSSSGSGDVDTLSQSVSAFTISPACTISSSVSERSMIVEGNTAAVEDVVVMSISQMILVLGLIRYPMTCATSGLHVDVMTVDILMVSVNFASQPKNVETKRLIAIVSFHISQKFHAQARKLIANGCATLR